MTSDRPAAGPPARLLGLALVAALVQAGIADADGNLRERIRLAIDEAFFHVEVHGTPREGFAATRQGKGFGIGPNLLITSRHIVGDPEEWQRSADTSRPEITRAVRPVSRTIALTRRIDGGTAGPANFVQPAPSQAIDATGIVVPGIEMKNYFHLSLCQIVPGGTYSAVLTTADEPASPESLESVDLVTLRAADYKPADYGPLYVFDIVGDPDFAREPEGHDGSPILDEDGNVVAIVSALTTEGFRHRVLATPMQPLFPGATGMLALAVDDRRAATDSLECSLADTVKRLHEGVSSLVIWDIGVDRDNDGRIDEVRFKYETVSREPNIASIDVLVSYFGEDSPRSFAVERSRPTKIRVTLPNDGILGIDQLADPRTFVTREIGRMGEKLVEPFVRDQAGDEARIDYVEVRIVPTFKDPPRQGRVSVFEFPYFAPSLARER